MKKTAFLLKALFILAILTAALSVSVSAAALGDVDADGKVTAADARLALRASVGLEKYTANSAPFTASDVDADGRITAADARLILRAAVGLEKLVPKHVHSFGAWTAEKNEKGIATGKHVRTCACGEKETAACSFGSKVYTSSNKTPTCTQGTTYYTECSVCKYKKTGGEAKLGHNYVTSARTEATCTVNGSKTSKCKRCGDVKTEVLPAPGHRCRGTENFSINKDIVCIVCGEKVLPSFNTLVNGLKDGSHTFRSFEKNVSSGKLLKNNIKVNPIFEALMGDEDFGAMLAEEFTHADESYSSYTADSKLTAANFPLIEKTIVSALKDEDVKSLTVTPMNSIDMLSALPDSVKMTSVNGSTYNFSLADYKTNAAHKVNKVEITIPSEKYSTIKNNSDETALMRIYGSDLRKLVKEMPSGDMEEEGMSVKMTLADMTSDLTVTYYFDAATNAPLAAVYAFGLSMDQHVTMDFSLESINVMSGTMDMTLNSHDCIYYFFNGYFK